MAHEGSLSITFAKAFSASSYSKECSSSIARLKSALVSSLQEVRNTAVPNSLLGVPQEMISPRFKFSSPMVSVEGEVPFCLQDATSNASARPMCTDLFSMQMSLTLEECYCSFADLQFRKILKIHNHRFRGFKTMNGKNWKQL